MKVLFLLNNDINSLKSLNILLKNLKFSQISIIFSQKVGNLRNKNPYLDQIKHYEQDLLVKYSRKLEKENKFSKFLTFNQLSKKYFINNIEIANINSKDSENKIKKLNLDLIISIRYGQILQENIIKLPNSGVINLHSGILPKYRGIMASFWSILNKEKEIGSTLHFIEDKKIDNGQIIKISKQKINFQRSLIFNIFTLYDQGCQMIIDFLNNKMKIDKDEDIDISSGEKLYFSLPKEENFKDLEKIIDISNDKDITQIYQNLS